MPKIDFKKELKHLYSPSKKEITVVDVPAMNFLMLDGKGNPNTATSYQQAVETLYSVSYTLKFMIKKTQAVDYGVLPLEGLWWADDMSQFSAENKDAWLWTAMIMQPEFVTTDLVEQAKSEAAKKKDLPALSLMRFEPLHEKRSAQIMHIGPYSDEGPTIARIHEFIQEQGGRLHGKHHEIYLGDPRRTAPEKLKTVIRQPFK